MRITAWGPLLRNAGSVCFVLLAISQCSAQTATPANQRNLVRISQLKPDMVSEWLSIQKSEVNPAFKKAGIATRTVLETVLGNPYEYVSITPMGNFSELDGDNALVKALGKDAAERLLAKTRRCIDSQTLFVSTRIDELSSVPKNPASIWVTTRYRAAPGMGTDYEAFLKSDVMPVVAKAKAAGKIAGYSVARRGPGADTRDRTTVVYLNKIADMEAGTPLTQMLGADGAAKLAKKGASLSAVVELVVRRRLPDLSY